MKDLISTLERNPKVNYVKTKTKESLSDAIEYLEISVIINTHRNLVELARAIYIKPFNETLCDVEVFEGTNPIDTLLKDIYLQYKVKDWVAPSYGHDNPKFVVRVPSEIVNQIINWRYSKIN